LCENAQAEALTTDDFGEVAVFRHLAGFGGLFRLELLFGMLFCMPNTVDGFDGAHGDLAQEVLDLGEDLLDARLGGAVVDHLRAAPLCLSCHAVLMTRRHFFLCIAGCASRVQRMTRRMVAFAPGLPLVANFGDS
jgi:hypothetical protein